MNRQNYIDSNSEILTGKPIVIGTRLSVEFIADLIANGWSRQQVLDNYPQLTPESLQAAIDFAAEGNSL